MGYVTDNLINTASCYLFQAACIPLASQSIIQDGNFAVINCNVLFNHDALQLLCNILMTSALKNKVDRFRTKRDLLLLQNINFNYHTKRGIQYKVVFKFGVFNSLESGKLVIECIFVSKTKI